MLQRDHPIKGGWGVSEFSRGLGGHNEGERDKKFNFYLACYQLFIKYIQKYFNFFTTMYCMVLLFYYIFALSCYMYDIVVKKINNYENNSQYQPRRLFI